MKIVKILLLNILVTISYDCVGQINNSDTTDYNWKYYFNEGQSYAVGIRDYKSAIKYYTKALKAAKSEFGIQHTNFGLTSRDLAYCYQITGKYQKAIKFNIIAINALKVSNGVNSELYIRNVNQLITVYKKLGYEEKASLLLKELELSQ